MSVAVLVCWLALVAPTMRVADPVSVDFPDETLHFGYGKNIVNVTLVDTRAWDTMGEISVLLAAATGIASLVYLRTRGPTRPVEDLPAGPAARTRTGRRPRRPGPVRPGAAGTGSPGPTRCPHSAARSSSVTTRLIFHTMLMFSLFLLFSGHRARGRFLRWDRRGIALAVRYLAGGRYELQAAPVHPVSSGFGDELARPPI